MKLTWIGHSCFKVEKDGAVIVLDPYADGSVPGYKPVRECAEMALCSHEHGDHNGRSAVTLTGENKNVFTVEIIDTYHDEVKGAKRGLNKIHVISDGEYKIAHMGDLGCELEEDQKAALKDLDAILVPVGGFFTIDANQAAALVHELEPKHVIPMHFRNDAAGTGYDMIGTVDAFVKQMQSVKISDGCSLDLAEEIAEQVVVLKAQNQN